ncbi:MAG: DUF1669 domain-containing protein, partial [Anaerolineae bacterium]|nr:DUF1669 domain-containing protein [Anaerolineae bacterium]
KVIVAVTSAPTSVSATSVGRATNWLTVYFSTPGSSSRTFLDSAILPALTRATKTIDVAMFDLNLPSFVQALVDAKGRGVTVRVVVDQENGNTKLDADLNGGKAFDAIKTLKAADIPVVNGGRSSGLMHAKIIIVDGQTLFVGSWNASYNDTFRNNNNELRIVNPQLVLNYQAEFEDMFVNKQFGARSVLRAIQPVLTIDGTPVENYFAPRDKVMDKLVTEANKGRRTIRVMIFTFTADELAKQLISQAKLGVNVQVVIEARGSTQGVLSTLFCAKQANLSVRTDGNGATMHHKVMIIDDETVITGSYNFTKAADTTNDDSLLIIRNGRVASQYVTEFDRVFAQAKPPEGIKCR